MLSIAITPEQAVLALAAPVLLISYASLRRFGDPIQCGHGCLHLEGCAFYVPTAHDYRRPVRTVHIHEDAAHVDEAERWIDTAVAKAIVFALKVGLVAGSLLSIMPAALYAAHRLLRVPLDYHACHCKHNTNAYACPLGREYLPPPGHEHWIARGDGYYDSPDGQHSKEGIKQPVLPARILRERLRKQKAMR